MADKTNDDNENRPGRPELKGNLGGILGGLGNLIENLTTLAEKAQELKQSGEFQTTHQGKEVRGVYGVRFKVGINEQGTQDEVKVEPFGNVRHDKTTGETVVAEVREPIIDLFEEDDHLLIIAEMPGVSSDSITMELQEDILTLSAEQGEKKYRKEILLPGTFSREKMTLSSNNGVVEIRCEK